MFQTACKYVGRICSALFIAGLASGCGQGTEGQPASSGDPVERLTKSGGRVGRDEKGNIIRAEFYSVSAPSEAFGPLKDLSRLEEVIVVEAKGFDDEAMAALSGHAHLQKLDLIRCPITDKGLAILPSCPAIAELNLSHLLLDGSGLHHLAELPKLETLKIIHNTITAPGLADLGKLSQLRHLFLEAPKLRLKELTTLGQLGRLESLNLHGTPLGDDDLEAITALGPHLSVLDFDADAITDEGLVLLDRFQKLKSLALVHAKITDAGLLNLKHLTGLEDLNLRYCESFTNAGLKRLAMFQNLKRLTLSGTGVKEPGVENFSGLNHLQTVQFETSQIDSQKAKQLVKILPQCEVEIHSSDGSVKVIRHD